MENFNLSFKDIKELSQSGFNLIPLCTKRLSDLETPVSAFLKLKPIGANMLLESVEGGEKWGRFSMIGIGNLITVKSKGKFVEVNNLGRIGLKNFRTDPLEVIKDIYRSIKPFKDKSLPPVWGGFFGYVGYDVVKFLEKKVRTKKQKEDSLLYDMVLSLPEALLIFDNVSKTVTIVSYILTNFDLEAEYKRASELIGNIETLLKREIPEERGTTATSKPWKVNVSDENFKENIKTAKKYISRGDVIQVVLSRRFEKPFYANPIKLYRALRYINPSPYMYFLDYGDFQIVGASPEVLVRVRNGIVETRPIAGTRQRGKNVEEDKNLEKELLSDEKERAEHIMLVDLARNDVGKVCQVGSVKVTQLMTVERYSHVMHIVSNVIGRLKKNLDSFDVLKACFPAGTVSGAPKVRAMQIIDEMEPSERGAYAGAVGYISLDGNLDTAIAIRTAIIRRSKVYVQAGAGIVADSVPESETRETLNKAEAVFKAVEFAEKGLKP